MILSDFIQLWLKLFSTEITIQSSNTIILFSFYTDYTLFIIFDKINVSVSPIFMKSH